MLIISFEIITSSYDKDILYNLPKKWDEILKLSKSRTIYILKDFGDLIIEQKDKRLYYRVINLKYES